MNEMEVKPQVGFEVQGINIAVGYVTAIVDLWVGDRQDPSVEVARYIGVWFEDQLQNGAGEAVDPDYDAFMENKYRRRPKPEPKVWETIEIIKEADREAIRFSKQQEELMRNPEMSWGSNKRSQELYQAFLKAVDVLATDYENEEAWKAVDAWRHAEAMKHEK